ncbi:MAG: dihydrolipoyl dehydrogenase [Candidatus Omnitrophica bacterium]|nr:dihydrolipoyl dehydrogenase [Candidatus Omnitrophota bacterium]
MDYDLVIIGAGWAGFYAAITAKKAGLKVVLIEKGQIGGTCLNRGCIPTKSLIHLSHSPALDFTQIQTQKEKVIALLQQGVQFNLKGIDYLQAEAKIISSTCVNTGSQELKTKSILIASGSRPIQVKGLEFDGKKILSSDEVLNLKARPASLLIVGGGVIGCEFASFFHNLGTTVTLAEKMPQLLPNEDREVAKKLETLFKKKGIKVNTGVDATTLDLANCELVLVCVGRQPNTEGLGLENAGVKVERSRIIVDDYLKTNIPNIYAVGDCTGKIMLAHYAAYQGQIAAQNISQPANLKKADNQIVPNCIFTDPEIASVGMNEEAAKAKSIAIKIHKFDFLGSGMARVLEETDGFIKIISQSESGEILGASIIGPRATELIAVLTLAITNHLKVNQVKDTIFAHPTISEAIHEALN